jgi:hypothetical protein
MNWLQWNFVLRSLIENKMEIILENVLPSCISSFRLKEILYSPNRKAVLAFCYWIYSYTVNKLCIPFCAMDKYEYEKILIFWVDMSCCIVNSSYVLKHCIVFIRAKQSWTDFTNWCNVTSRKTRTLEFPAAFVWEHQSSLTCMWELRSWYNWQLSLTLVDLQLDTQNSYLFTYNTFIKILYMFRALPRSSSGGLCHNCIYAASGIVTVCRWLSCAPVNRCTGQSHARNT